MASKNDRDPTGHPRGEPVLSGNTSVASDIQIDPTNQDLEALAPPCLAAGLSTALTDTWDVDVEGGASLSLRRFSSGGGGSRGGRFATGDAVRSSSSCGALWEVDETHRHSWGSYDGGGAGGSGYGNRYGNPYGADEGAEDAQRGSWGSDDAAGTVYGSYRCGGGAAVARSGGAPHAAEVPAAGPLAGSVVARQRWRRAVAAVGEVRRLHRSAQTLADKHSLPADRLFAALTLALQRHNWAQIMSPTHNPHRTLLRHYVDKKLAGQWGSWWERLEAEFIITGTIVFDWCTPARLGEHWPLFTGTFLLTAGLLFAFMAGQFPYFAALEAAAAAGGACSEQLAAAAGAGAAKDVADKWPAGTGKSWSACFLTAHSGPRFLGDVVLQAPGSEPATTFSDGFLRAWGGLYAPDVQRGQVYRWLTGPLLHITFRHAAANLALTAALGWQMEAKYGTVRVMTVWLAAVVGGELLSVAVEDPCRQLVGCSGGAFGLLGLFCADTLLHFSSLRRPILRCATIAVLLGFLVYTLAVQQGNMSSMAHVGGLLCGLLPALMVLPRLGSEHWEAAWPALGLLAVVVCFAVLPAWVYTRRLPAAVVQCLQQASRPAPALTR
ncbi:hypothetical protein VOLCADRAFT_90873 [Volvox carteri f. nagariensis]|uniref:RHOMBOID-like protein n=1 Tax=Volvox carteri f. nagariensis TaxID=3068 RepID=D8TVA4_VOLCA|nr:uncharacterized protein VOLCADRAFT_90873 [Volvox carteri f. nagariensis]EFJ48541.1 hypothetical protein VOLCADRAFT_90873 [Volvox carteri f. nagariensis]|eukprot:XP_002950340.1 hypothetical protein VOLCADRAFT_90873 [Volvox carteri f. nagariensis]